MAIELQRYTVLISITSYVCSVQVKFAMLQWCKLQRNLAEFNGKILNLALFRRNSRVSLYELGKDTTKRLNAKG